MKRNTLSILSILILSLFSACGEDEESCSLNGRVNGECFNAILGGYNAQSITQSNASFTRENIFISYQFEGTRAERYQITARANQYDGQNVREDGASYLFEERKVYSETSMIFNGNINNPASGTLTVTFSKVDRENGLVSGSFTWISGNGDLSGLFNDVAVSLEEN